MVNTHKPRNKTNSLEGTTIDGAKDTVSLEGTILDGGTDAGGAEGQSRKHTSLILSIQ